MYNLKLITSILIASVLSVNAFNNGVNSGKSLTKKVSSKAPVAFTKDATSSPLFRDPTAVRAGAIPGWSQYNDSLDDNPLTTKALTSLVGWALGDLLAQTFIGKGAFDMKRFISLSAFGLLYHGPSGHYFYNWLDSKIPGTESKVIALKVATDQILWCPLFMTVFFTYLGLVNGDSFATIGNKVKDDLLTACQGSWKVWPIVHAVNFKFIKTKHRLVFINAVQVAFNMFLSLIGSKK